jgi:hypothetical protein
LLHHCHEQAPCSTRATVFPKEKKSELVKALYNLQPAQANSDVTLAMTVAVRKATRLMAAAAAIIFQLRSFLGTSRKGFVRYWGHCVHRARLTKSHCCGP